MSITRLDRRVITFYSFKGGVGRTMALANVAFRLADVHALNVIAVDWDLEAPGLHDFFGITAETMTGARGLLDYFAEWKAAAERGDANPPDVTDRLIRIKEGPGVPRHGSISLLVAGRMDGSYGERLAALDWREFYAKHGGSLAVETLRKQLVANADIVLVDSRTGYTDAGGICTVQLPDGVVLMTAPNKQSLEGVERVAETIARARGAERAGRENIRLWLSVSRVPSVEETYRADAWFEKQAPRFDDMIRRGVLLKEDHPDGMRSYEIPHRARWGFEEPLIVAVVGPDARDQLWLAYESLTVTLLEWSVGPFEVATEANRTWAAMLDELRDGIAEAERREDIAGLLMIYVELGRALEGAKQYEEGAGAMRRAAVIAIGANLPDYHAAIKSILGSILSDQGHHEEAVAEEEAALDIARKLKDDRVESVILFRFALVKYGAGDHDGARRLLTAALDKMRVSGDEAPRAMALRVSVLLHALMTAKHQTAMQEEMAEHFRAELRRRLLVRMLAYYQRGDRTAEAQAIEELIKLSTGGPPFAEEDVLRARLSELRGGSHVAGAPPPTPPETRKPSPTRLKAGQG